jgi:hypothetical protein
MQIGPPNSNIGTVSQDARRLSRGHWIDVRRKSNLSWRINVICAVQSRLQRYSASRSPQIKPTTLAIPPFHKGRFAIVTNVARDAVDAEGALDETR